MISLRLTSEAMRCLPNSVQQPGERPIASKIDVVFVSHQICLSSKRAPLNNLQFSIVSLLENIIEYRIRNFFFNFGAEI